LGDIQGISYVEFRKFRNCGKKTVTELHELVRAIQRAHPISHVDGISHEFTEPFVALVGDGLTVPASVQDLNFCDLPVSVRLGNVLAERKATRLGDLNGVSVRELKSIKNCGKSTISEIVNLIEEAVAGEFKTITDSNVGWSSVDLTSFLDALILELSARDAEILELRLSGEKEQLPTLEDVGAKFKLTRERIRQIVKKITAQLRKAGSRRLNAYLSHVEKVCCETVCPLTPELTFATPVRGGSHITVTSDQSLCVKPLDYSPSTTDLSFTDMKPTKSVTSVTQCHRCYLNRWPIILELWSHQHNAAQNRQCFSRKAFRNHARSKGTRQQGY